jgi:hypothetical protein
MTATARGPLPHLPAIVTPELMAERKPGARLADRIRWAWQDFRWFVRRHRPGYQRRRLQERVTALEKRIGGHEEAWAIMGRAVGVETRPSRPHLRCVWDASRVEAQS